MISYEEYLHQHADVRSWMKDYPEMDSSMDTKEGRQQLRPFEPMFRDIIAIRLNLEMAKLLRQGGKVLPE